MVRLLIADDHDVVRAGLRRILESRADWSVVAEAADGRRAIAQAITHKPDIAIVDYSLPLIREECESFEEIPCHLVDLGPSFDDGSGFARPELISIDGIHPTDAGAVLMANEVWATMNEHCLAVE